MFNSDYYVRAESAYREERIRRSLAAPRGRRSRASWLRRVAAADQRIS